MREIDEVRITLLRMFRGAVQLPQEIIDEMLKAFLHARNAAIKVRAITKGYLVRRFPHDYMDDAAAKAFNYYLGRTTLFNWVGLYPSMQHRNDNMSRARLRYLRYRDDVRRRTGTLNRHSVRSGGTYSHNWSDVFNS